MKPLSLQDIRPQQAEFYLKKTDRTYPLRPINLEDESWLRVTFGARLQSILDGTDVSEIARILWRLMSEEDRQTFPMIEVQETSEGGVTSTVRKGGAQLLAQSIFGMGERIVIHRALLDTIGFSKPILDALQEESLKKNSPKESSSQSAGQRSSTSLPRNTGGPSTTSGRSRRAKSPSPSGKSTSGKARSSRSKRHSTGSKSTSPRRKVK